MPDSPAVRLPLAAGVEPSRLSALVAQHVWYHRIGLGEHLVTPGVARYEAFQRPVLRALRALPLTGRRVLDVGCRDGLFAFEAERLGAAEVVGIDNNLSPGATAVLIPALGSRVRMEELNLLDATAERLGRFDLIVFAGVLYHLRDPFAGLRVLAELLVEGGVLIVETALLLGAERWAELWCPIGRDGPYDATSPSFFNRKGLVDTLTSLGIAVDGFELLGDPLRHPSSWRARLLGRTRRVDRATLACRRVSRLADSTINAYWYGTHATRKWS